MKFTEQTDGRYLADGKKEVKHAIRGRLMAVCDRLDLLYEEIKITYEKIHELEAQGISEASIHWRRKGDPAGRPDQLELLHPTGSAYEKRTGRRREYIGTDPEKQQEAIARVRRWRAYQDAQGEVKKIKDKMTDIVGRIKHLEWTALGEQKSFGDDWQFLASSQRPHENE